MARNHDFRYVAHLRDLIIAQREAERRLAHPLPLAEASSDAFPRSDRREDGYIRVVLIPSASRASASQSHRRRRQARFERDAQGESDESLATTEVPMHAQ